MYKVEVFCRKTLTAVIWAIYIRETIFTDPFTSISADLSDEGPSLEALDFFYTSFRASILTVQFAVAKISPSKVYLCNYMLNYRPAVYISLVD